MGWAPPPPATEQPLGRDAVDQRKAGAAYQRRHVCGHKSWCGFSGKEEAPVQTVPAPQTPSEALGAAATTISPHYYYIYIPSSLLYKELKAAFTILLFPILSSQHSCEVGQAERWHCLSNPNPAP